MQKKPNGSSDSLQLVRLQRSDARDVHRRQCLAPVSEDEHPAAARADDYASAVPYFRSISQSDGSMAMDRSEVVPVAAGDADFMTGRTVLVDGSRFPTACAVANRTHPDTVRRVHESYLEAGADVIITNTFATCRHMLEGAGLGDETVAINRRAVELALEARDRAAPDRPVAVAGSMSNALAWLPGTGGPDPAYLPTREKEARGSLCR